MLHVARARGIRTCPYGTIPYAGMGSDGIEPATGKLADLAVLTHTTGVASDQSNDVVFPNCGSIQSCKCCSSKVYAVG